MYKVKEITQTCFACPSQWEGKTIGGDEVYIRYRHGDLRVDINDNTVWGDGFGDPLDGFMTYDELKINLKDVLELPEVCENDMNGWFFG